MSPALDQARRHLDQKEYEPCFSILRDYWLGRPDDLDVVRLLSRLMSEVGRSELASHLANLCEHQDRLTHDAQSLFEIGFRFIDERQHELACMLLTRCLALHPEEPLIDYELGFALMSLRRYAEAIPHFQTALVRADDFDTRLNLCASYVCTRQLEKAREMLQAMDRLAEGDEQQRALSHQTTVVRRMEALADRPLLAARDWLYAQYGTILLAQSDDPARQGKFGAIWNDYAGVATVLLMLRGLLEGLGVNFHIVEFYSSLSRPLAECLGELLDLPVEPYRGPSRAERALLVMAWASDIIGPHESFIPHMEQRSLFAYGLTSEEALPLTPELVGCLAASCAMPWGERWKVETFADGRPAQLHDIGRDDDQTAEASVRLIERARSLEADPDILNAVQEAVGYYSVKQPLLVLGNSQAFLERPEYTAEVPV